jgi:dipeptidyl aminopeptidase/acylaminoacyl peptidase
MRIGRRLASGFALALLAAAAVPAADPPSGKWTIAEMLAYRPVSDVRVSPDGRRVAFVVREAVMEADKSEFRDQIWIGATDGKSPARPVTFAGQSSGRPRWSPDGRWIAFLSKRGDPHVNVWLLPADGGEAWRLTDARSSVARAEWSPDGKAIAFIAPKAAPDDQERRDRERDDARVVGQDERPGRLWLATVTSDPSDARGAKPLHYDGASITDLDWSPDGATIAIAHTRHPVADAWPSSDISLLDVATGHVRPLARTGASESDPAWSPDGKWIAYIVTDDPARWAHRRWIRLAPADGGPARDLPSTFDEDPNVAGWSADGSTLYFTEARGVSNLLYALDVRTGAARPLTAAGAVTTDAAVNARGNWIGFLRQSLTEPVEAYASPLPSFAPVRLSSVNAGLPRHPLGQTRVVTWAGDQGRTIEGLLTLPVGVEAGRRSALLLVVHGGPAGVYQSTYPAAPGPYPDAVFASEGYAVLRANPRGSSGYGTAFRQANIDDWGGGDYRDLMAGVDRVIASGDADPNRLGILGWSYGGFMTAWTITQTDRFKAASVGAALTDLVSFTGTTDIPSFVPDYFGGDFWTEGMLEVYRKHSPMAFVGNVRTPTIIQHGEEDPRVPISQGYQFYEALERRGVPVEMVVYPRQKHPVREPRLILDLARRNLEWMDKYVKGSSATP